jgi:hypothetical protein
MAGADKKLEGIYVDLDALLDTRIGTVSLIDPTIASTILNSNNYHTRDEDIFEGIDTEVFKKKYKERDVETLSASILTNIVPLIRHLISGLTIQATARPFHDGGSVTVNYYPYNLTPEECQLMGKAMDVWLHGDAPITLISCPPEDLTPIYCKDNFVMMIKYEYAEWLEIQAVAFASTQIPDITLLSPAIYFGNKPPLDDLKAIAKESMHPIAAAEFLMSSVIGLALIDVKYFSVLSNEGTA